MILRSKKLRWFEALDALTNQEFPYGESYLEIRWEKEPEAKRTFLIRHGKAIFPLWLRRISLPWLQGRDLVNRPEIDINKTPKVFL